MHSGGVSVVAVSDWQEPVARTAERGATESARISIARMNAAASDAGKMPPLNEEAPAMVGVRVSGLPLRRAARAWLLGWPDHALEVEECSNKFPP